MATPNAPTATPAKIEDPLAELFGTSASLAKVDPKAPAKAETPSGFTQIPYLGYYSPKAKSNIDRLKEAGVGIDQFYFYDFEPLPLKPARIAIFTAYQFWDKVDDNNKTEDVSAVKEPGFGEHLIGACLVKTSGGWRGATFSHRKGLCRAFNDLLGNVKTIVADKGVAFAKRGEKAATAVASVPFPQFAMLADIHGKQDKTQPDEKGKRWDFNLSIASLGVTSKDEAEGMWSYLNDPNGKVEWAGVLRSFLARKKEAVDRIAKKNAGTK